MKTTLTQASFILTPCFLLLFLLVTGKIAVSVEAAAPTGPEVTVMQVSTQPTRVSLDIIGEIRAFREVELRARVTGTLNELKFKPGQKVKEGDLLFIIDADPYQAALTNAQAGLAQARAGLSRVQQDVERYKPLLPDNAIPRQVYDQTVAQAAQEEAVVASKKAAVERAQLDLDYTRVRSPLAGRVGLQKIEVGTLVSAGQTILANVSTLDPVVVYFSVSEDEYLAYSKRKEIPRQAGHAVAETLVDLILADGEIYPEKGRIDYIDPTVNPTTGTLTLRAIFANPKDLLRPGMNSRVRVYGDEIEAAILIPQKSVTETLGKYFVTVIGAGNKAEMRPVTLGSRIGALWLVKSGLEGGERIVVEGIQKARSGMTVTPVPVDMPAAGK
jgi:membrane fusion protein (multidrug efflux system)